MKKYGTTESANLESLEVKEVLADLVESSEELEEDSDVEETED